MHEKDIINFVKQSALRARFIWSLNFSIFYTKVSKYKPNNKISFA